jgi:hypothetical protein
LIESLCTAECPEPTLQPFIFEGTAAASHHNKTILSTYLHHLGNVIGDFPNSSISYGSEFRPIHQLEPLLQHHPSWPKFCDLLTHGSRYPVQDRNPMDRTRDLAFFQDYGNHKSASTPEGTTLALTLLEGDVQSHRALPLPVSYVESIVGSEFCALGIAKQHTISPSGEIIEKHRACHDHTFAGPSGHSLNTRTIKENLQPCSYGHCLRRIINYIVYLRSRHPSTPILMSKIDLDSAYRRLHTHWSFAVQCIVILGAFAYLLLRLPFGAAAAPSEFCVVSELICDLANALLQDGTWDPSTTTTPFHQMMPPATLLDSSIPFAQAAPMDITYSSSEFDCTCDVYIDDLISIGLALAHIIPRLTTAVLVAISCVFRPVHHSESSFRSAAISLRKLLGEGQPAETKTILGWLLNSRTLTICLPPAKHLAWTSEIQRLLAQGFTSKSDLETLIGRLNHVGYTIPLARHFLHRLRSLLASPWSRHTKAIPQTHQEDLKLWITILSSAASGISLNLLCYRTPEVTCWSDASLTGIGGYDSTGQAWRWELPMECRGRLTLNGLEYLASIITIEHYLGHSTSTYPCILSLLDSTSAIGWLYRSSFDLSSHSIHATLARHLATIMIDQQACLYSQHIPGTTNVIADSLSRDFHIPTDQLACLIRSNFQVPASFTIYPLTAGRVSWLTSLMLSRPRQLELKTAHTPSATWLGVDGSNTSTPPASSPTPSLTNLSPLTASTSSVPSCMQYVRADSLEDPNLSRPTPPERPLTTWRRNSRPPFVPTPEPTPPAPYPS